MRKFLMVLLVLCSTIGAQAETKFNERPKLVVGIVVDQMRWDYLGRYYDQFQTDGFRRLIDEGYSCDNCLINYLPTVTAIGHTSAYTGTTPAFHGICGNDFFIDDEKAYCCGDSTVMPVGTDNNKRGKMSPRNLLSTTIGDQLRMHTDFRSKVVGVSYKDRAAILPAGRSANGAYWLDTDNGQFITSTYYRDELPDWAKAYNQQLKKNKELQKVGKRVGFYPLCGHITADMAIAAMKGEQLGQGEATDMLCISFSQTDVIGHEWSTRGEHTDEAYLELDRDIAKLLKAFDEQVGKGNYIVFLTADHGAAHNFQWMEDHKMAGGAWRVKEDVMGSGLKAYLRDKLGADLSIINGINSYRVYLNHGRIAKLGLELSKVKEALIDYARQMPHVQFVMDFEKVNTWSVPDVIRSRALLGYHPHRSGDLLLVLEAGWYEFWTGGSSPVGTTHGEWNPYDAHIPLLFYGWKVEHGSTSREVHITDIAPTICQKLHIQQPNACVGEAIIEVVEGD
ncbi:MAG: alkaline phosphatase family protein [Prevotella sp.]|nr:alkaline phosphatase family protein [Prevotella sp.]